MFSHEDKEKLLNAIRFAEAHTSGEIILHIREKTSSNTLDSAKDFFYKNNLHQSAARNNVLILIAKKDHTFAVYADEGIHLLAPPTFWYDLVADLEKCFHNQEYVLGLLKCICKIGEILKAKFPSNCHQNNIDDMSED